MHRRWKYNSLSSASTSRRSILELPGLMLPPQVRGRMRQHVFFKRKSNLNRASLPSNLKKGGDQPSRRQLESMQRQPSRCLRANIVTAVAESFCGQERRRNVICAKHAPARDHQRIALFASRMVDLLVGVCSDDVGHAALGTFGDGSSSTGHRLRTCGDGTYARVLIAGTGHRPRSPSCHSQPQAPQRYHRPETSRRHRPWPQAPQRCHRPQAPRLHRLHGPRASQRPQPQAPQPYHWP